MNIAQVLVIDKAQIVTSLGHSEIKLIAKQFQKDFELSGASFEFNAEGIETIEDLLTSTIAIVSKIIQVSPKNVMNLLYRADIPEREVSSNLQLHKELDSAIVISVLLLLKANKKLELRRRFS